MHNGAGGSHFEIVLDEEARPPVVVASGELDAASSQEFELAIATALDAGQGVTLDLSAVTFIDSSALRVVTVGLRRARDEDQAFSVPAASAVVRRLFDITGVSPFMTF